MDFASLFGGAGGGGGDGAKALGNSEAHTTLTFGGNRTNEGLPGMVMVAAVAVVAVFALILFTRK